jgi:hypothetical protein
MQPTLLLASILLLPSMALAVEPRPGQQAEQREANEADGHEQHVARFLGITHGEEDWNGRGGHSLRGQGRVGVKNGGKLSVSKAGGTSATPRAS